MKILILADTECRYFWDYYKPGYLKDYDLIVSCGDLKPEYLSFLVTMGRAPVVYVHGNHDGYYAQRPPEGCLSIEDTVFRYGESAGMELKIGGEDTSIFVEHNSFSFIFIIV